MKKSATSEVRQIFLKPGELFIGCEPSLVTTLLGSCVAVTMFNGRLKLGGICHAMLPHPRHSADGQSPEPNKYVSLVIPTMLEIFGNYGVLPEEIEVKMFGGANVIGNEHAKSSENAIGSVNIRRAQQVLNGSRLKVMRSHIGGVVGRKLIFNTATGEVLLKQLTNSANKKD